MKLQKYKRESEVSYAMGATLVAELLKTQPHAITRVFLRPAKEYGEKLKEIIDDLNARKIEIIESTKAFNILGAKDNCLLMAEFRKNTSGTVSDASSRRVILVNPSDAGNLGTIMRSAVAFGYKNLTVILPGVDPYDPKVVRASMGAIFHLNIHVTNSIGEVEFSKTSLAFVLDENAIELGSISAKDNKGYDLVFGNEAAGLPKDFCQKTGARPVYIRQGENVDSLNLGVAASIAMHYFSLLG